MHSIYIVNCLFVVLNVLERTVLKCFRLQSFDLNSLQTKFSTSRHTYCEKAGFIPGTIPWLSLGKSHGARWFHGNRWRK